MPPRASGAGTRSGARALACALLLAAACADGPSLEVVSRTPLADSAATTLWVDDSSRLWLGAAGEVRIVDGGREAARTTVGGDGVPDVLGTMAGRVWARDGDRLLALDPQRGTLLAARGGMGSARLVLDPRGRAILQAASSGAVLAHDPETLEPVWAWAALGAPTAGAAASPDGDRLYQALDAPGEGGVLRVRDVQTGRTVSAEALSAPVHALLARPDGTLLAATGEAGRTVAALDPSGGALRLLWRRALPGGDGAAARLRLSPDGRRVAVIAGGERDGLRVLDAETGEVLGSGGGAVRDAAFGPDGLLYLLDGDGVRAVRPGGGG